MAKTTKTLITVFVSGIITLSATMAPQALAKEPRGHGGKGERFMHLDSDGDEMLSIEEFTAPVPEKAAKLLQVKDSNADGVFDLEEFSQTRRGSAINLTAIAQDIIQCVSDLKAETGNEEIVVPSLDHFKTPQEKFESVDTSGDGFVDLAELEAAKLSKANVLFTAIDGDADGFITLEEYKAHKGSRHATKRALHQCIDELITEE